MTGMCISNESRNRLQLFLWEINSTPCKVHLLLLYTVSATALRGRHTVDIIMEIECAMYVLVSKKGVIYFLYRKGFGQRLVQNS